MTKLLTKNKSGKKVWINVPSVDVGGGGYPPRGSIQFNNLNGIQTDPHIDFQIDSQNFTVEWFQYMEYLPIIAEASLVFETVIDNDLGCEILPGNLMHVWTNGTTPLTNVPITNYFNKWSHFAITRQGTVVRVFQNGIMLSEEDLGVIVATGNTERIQLGGLLGFSPFIGKITNFRFIKGTCLYSSDFNVSTLPLTVVANTKLLLLAQVPDLAYVDSSGLHTITNTQTTWSIENPFVII